MSGGESPRSDESDATKLHYDERHHPATQDVLRKDAGRPQEDGGAGLVHAFRARTA